MGEKQIDIVVEMLSERRKGKKLKKIAISHSSYIENAAEITFTFEGDKENEERLVGIYGKDLQVSFGYKEQKE